jgi:flagellar biosynthesis GTPase FlhF
MGNESPINHFQYGFRIYHLIKNGPLEKIGCKSLSDFIIPPNEIISKKINFIDYLKINAGKEINLTIFSLLSRKSKIISIKCNEKNSNDGIIGASVNFENFINAHKNVLHIIKVKEYSFASVELKLKENEDFIIAVKPKQHEIISLNQENCDPLTVLGNIVQANKGNECEFFIYNVRNGGRSVVTKIGNQSDFVIGIEGAYGALHEFPYIREEEEDNNNEDNNNNNNKNENNKNENNNNSNNKNENNKENNKKEDEKKEKKDDSNENKNEKNNNNNNNENNVNNNNINNNNVNNNNNNVNNNNNINNKKEENVNDIFKLEEKKQEENNIFD